MQRNDGSLSEAQINRLRHVASMDKIAGLAAQSLRNAREERAKEFAEFEARIAARKARLKKLEHLSIDKESGD
jgi:histone H3/H4